MNIVIFILIRQKKSGFQEKEFSQSNRTHVLRKLLEKNERICGVYKEDKSRYNILITLLSRGDTYETDRQGKSII